MRVVATGDNLVPRHGARPLGVRHTTGCAGRGNRHMTAAPQFTVDLETVDPIRIPGTLDYLCPIGRLGVFLPNARRLKQVAVCINDGCQDSLPMSNAACYWGGSGGRTRRWLLIRS